jgi:hypothetical protein
MWGGWYMKIPEYKQKAYEIITIIEGGISSLQLFSSGNKKIINVFADLELSPEQAEMRRFILSVYTRYQGKVDFRNRENPKNQELKLYFLDQLSNVKNKLKDF